MLRKIMLNDHIGGSAISEVKIGDTVKKGQLIAKPSGLGSNVHASFQGVITEITDLSITIDADNEQPEEFIKLENKENKLEMIQDAGIIGAGGAGFPTHVKLNTKLKDGCIIVNAAECEPILSHNIKLLNESGDKIIKGLKEVMALTNAKKGIIAIKPKHKKTLIHLGKMIKEMDDIELFYLPNIYPAGDERVIIREVLDIELEPGQLPLVANAIVTNVETVKNIYNCIYEQKPVITKDLTVGGRVNGCSDGKAILDVPIGTTMIELIEDNGGYQKNHGEIVIGGPFTGRRGSESSVVGKTTGGCLVAMPFPQETRKIGLLECECGAQKERLSEIAEAMGAEVIASERCKRMTEVNGRYRCDLPGECPGQTETVINLKKQGAEVIIAGACEDWTNTATKVAPRLGVPIYHSTDHVLRATNHKLYRRMK